MGAKTGIAWTESTWNPIVGCSQVSEGCRHCYAETLDRRFRMTQEGTPYLPWTHPNAPLNVRCFPDRLKLPLQWREPRMVFVNSRSDLFHETVPREFRAEMWDVMREAKRHVFQVLTKRPENIPHMLPPDWGDGYPNVWLGVSGETFSWAQQRGDLLENVPSRVSFLSAEPWLEPRFVGAHQYAELAERFFDWVIVGGESGPKCRPMAMDTARALIRGCEIADVPVFLKQLGGWPDARSHDKAVIDGRTWTEMPSDADARA